MATSISDLPAEVLRVIAGRHLHAALDAVRFHAVCTSWRHTLHHLPRRRPLLPWLLAPPSSSSAAGGPCRCVFSKTTYHAGAAHARDRRLAHADGTASWFVDGFFLNPLTGFPSPDHDHEDEAYGWKLISDRYSRFVFSRNGTFLAYTLSPSPSPPSLVLTGQTWVPAGFESYVSVTLGGGGAGTERFVAVALHGGATVCVDLVNCYVSVHVDGLDRATSVPLPDVPTGMARRRSYLVELGGEVLLASVLQDDDGGDDRLSVSVHALEHDHDGEAPPMPVWEKRDGGVLADHVFFLGFPGSFAVEAARFGGELPGGSAYFVVRSEPCRVYRCGIDDVGGGTAAPATVVDTLPAGWDDERCMWFLPEPDIDPMIRRPARDTTPASMRRRDMRIYAGDLPPPERRISGAGDDDQSPEVESSWQREEMFSKQWKALLEFCGNYTVGIISCSLVVFTYLFYYIMDRHPLVGFLVLSFTLAAAADKINSPI